MAAIELVNSPLANDANLVSNWNFDSSNSNDRVGSNNGSDTSMAYNTTTGISGFGVKADFDGASSLITVADAASLRITSSFSISAWIKTSTSSKCIFQSASQNTAVAGIIIHVGLNTAHKFGIFSGNNTGTTPGTNYQAADSTTSVDDGAWHFVVATSDGSNLRVYVDGSLQSTVAWAHNPAYAATNYIRIGCEVDTGANINKFNGSVDDLAVWNRVLTQTEITNLFSGFPSASLGDSGYAYFM